MFDSDKMSYRSFKDTIVNKSLTPAAALMIGSGISGLSSIASSLFGKSKKKKGGGAAVMPTQYTPPKDLYGYMKAIPNYDMMLRTPNLASYYYNMGIVNSMLHGGDPMAYLPNFQGDTSQIDAQISNLTNQIAQYRSQAAQAQANIAWQNARNAERGTSHSRNRAIQQAAARFSDAQSKMEQLSRKLNELENQKRMVTLTGRVGDIVGKMYQSSNVSPSTGYGTAESPQLKYAMDVTFRC